MHTKVMHWGRKWPRPRNHLDGRVCPECSTTVHGNQAQHTHLQWHADQAEHEERLAATIEALCKRTGITEETVDLPWAWTAVVEDHSDDQEAISDGQEAS